MTTTAYEKIKATDQLPSPTGVAVELLRLADAEDTTAAIITPVVESDPAIASRLVRMANSSVAGQCRTIASVRQAVTFLGLRTVKLIALAFSLLSKHRSGECPSFDHERFWSESLARGATVRHLVKRLNCLPADEGFTLGLLSQIGRLGLATVFPRRYAGVLERIGGEDLRALEEAEARMFEIHTDELTAEMVADWGMPLSFSDALRVQGSREGAGLERGTQSHTLAQVIRMSALLAPVLVRGKADMDHLSALTNQCTRLGIEPEDFHAVFDRITEEWQEAGSILEINTPSVTPLAELYARADERRKAALAEESADVRAVHVGEKESLPSTEVEQLQALVDRLPELRTILEHEVKRLSEVVERHKREAAELKQKHVEERAPIDSGYSMAYNHLLEARHALHRLQDAGQLRTPATAAG